MKTFGGTETGGGEFVVTWHSKVDPVATVTLENIMVCHQAMTLSDVILSVTNSGAHTGATALTTEVDVLYVANAGAYDAAGTSMLTTKPKISLVSGVTAQKMYSTAVAATGITQAAPDTTENARAVGDQIFITITYTSTAGGGSIDDNMEDWTVTLVWKT